MKAGLLSMNEQPEADKILGITYEGDLRGIEDEKGVIVPLELSWEDIVALIFCLSLSRYIPIGSYLRSCPMEKELEMKDLLS